MHNGPLTQSEIDRIEYIIREFCKPEIALCYDEGFTVEGIGFVIHPRSFLDLFRDIPEK